MKLLNFGSCNIDYVYQLAHVVSVGETEATENMKIFPGGKGLNQSIAVSRAGGKVYHAGAVGQDGDFLLQLLKDNGVEVGFLKTVEEKTGHAIIQINNHGENAIFVYSGANACISKEYVDIVLQNFSKGDLLLLQNEISNIEYIIDKAFERGMIILLNPSPINEKIKLIDFKKISYLILNQTEAKEITRCEEEIGMLNYFKENYPEIKIVLTLGKDGSIYQDIKKKYYQASFKVDVVDTTAAGDTFTGYFVSGLMKGLSLSDNMCYASCAAAISVSKNGAAPSIPMFSEVVTKVSVLELKDGNVEDKRIKHRIERFIEQNITTVNITNLANELGYSVVYVGVLVKKLFGMTYKELLLDKRLNIASELLKNSNLSITDIISVVGYDSEGYFRKKFIQKYGKKPLEYRNFFR